MCSGLLNTTDLVGNVERSKIGKSRLQSFILARVFEERG
jgi:hypothetical protein